jgi:VWFA-related protein
VRQTQDLGACQEVYNPCVVTKPSACRLSLLAVAAVACLLGYFMEPPRVSAQAAPATQPSTAAHREITLDVRVTDKSGVTIRGLQQSDFSLLDDNKPRDITSFQSVGEPDNKSAGPAIEVVLVVDAVNAPFQNVALEHPQIHNFLTTEGGDLIHPLSLIAFTGNGTKIVNQGSTNGNEIATAYDRFQTGLRDFNTGQGVFGDAERFNLSANTFDSIAKSIGSLPGRKLLVWLSPGWPLLGGQLTNLTPAVEQEFFNSVVKESTELIAGRITVYTVDPLGLDDEGSVDLFKQYAKGIASPSKAGPPDLALQVLTVQSGGLFLHPSNDVASAISSCVLDANSYYVLTFDAAESKKPNEYHSISLKVDKPDVVARTRTGYYAQP